MIRRMRKKIQDMIKHVKKHKHFWRNVAVFCLSIFIFIFAVGALWIGSFKIPDFNSIESMKVINSTKIYDRTGEILLYDINKDIRRTNIPFEEMGVNIKNATVAVEDSEFYNHSGIRLSAIFRATIWAKLTGKKVTGGSTITQQLIKNTLLNARVTPARKIKEWILALKMEKVLPKEKILELYLNAVPYGGTLYGIEEASRTYFNKKPIDLSLAEAAYLAAIPQSPTVLSPYGKNRDKLDERKNFVLFRMNEVGFITTEEYEVAKAEVVNFVPQSLAGIKAPHFVFFIKDYLEEKYGSEMVQKGGLKVTTTLDYELEQKAEQIVKEGALKNEKDWNGKNASLVAIDPKTGQIISMVGSRDYFDKNIDGNFNVATANRQPGSSFKPFIYATAFKKGFTPDTVLFDLPTEFQTSCNAYGKALPGHSQSECYMPDNYDGLFRGPMSLRDALGQSINIPAIKLFYLAGLRDSLQTAEEMGISTLTDISRYGLTLVVGGGEVSLLDITSAYGVFANDGIRNPYTGILKVEDVNGNILEEYKPNEREVLPKNTALTISDVLSDNKARTPTFGANSVLQIPGKNIAVKTGTTNNNKDAWTVGYTPSIVVGVWAGNNENTPMKKGGSALAGPIWNKFMNEALKILPSESFEKPNLAVDPNVVKPALRGLWQGNESFFIDKISGKLATENTPPETREEKVITNVHTILYWIDRNDILGPAPENPQSNAQFDNWEIPVQNWWAKNKYRYNIVSPGDKPNSEDDIHTESYAPKISITSPNDSTTYGADERIYLTIENSGKFALKKMDIFVNGVYIGSSESPFNFSFVPKSIADISDENEIRIISYDEVFNRGETTSTFKVED
jgi:penicillin-binding protein 1C